MNNTKEPKEETSNFLQVGKTIECGTCHPEKFGDCKELRKLYKFDCQCICHNSLPPIEVKKEWEKEFDNLFVYTDIDDVTGVLVRRPWRPSFQLPDREIAYIKHFIFTLLSRQAQETEKRIREMVELGVNSFLSVDKNGVEYIASGDIRDMKDYLVKTLKP